MRYIALLVLMVGLVACDPSDAVDININPSQAVEDAIDGVQQGTEQLNDAVQNFGEGAGGGEGEAENGGEGENGEN